MKTSILPHPWSFLSLTGLRVTKNKAQISLIFDSFPLKTCLELWIGERLQSHWKKLLFFRNKKMDYPGVAHSSEEIFEIDISSGSSSADLAGTGNRKLAWKKVVPWSI